jgi:hypothetical protein
VQSIFTAGILLVSSALCGDATSSQLLTRDH